MSEIENVPFTKVKRVSKLYIMPMRILPAVLYISKTPGTVESNSNRMNLHQKHQGQVQIDRSNLKAQLWKSYLTLNYDLWVCIWPWELAYVFPWTLWAHFLYYFSWFNLSDTDFNATININHLYVRIGPNCLNNFFYNFVIFSCYYLWGQ